MPIIRSPDPRSMDAAALSARIEAWEPHIHSFVELADPLPDQVERPAAALSGLSVGVKDIIDVAGLRTRNGSATCQDVSPATQDATVVARLRQSGAEILGKTVTTEYAFTDPTDCRNPYDISRTPGGSSSGSGAAVAAGLADIALGTQTAGSLCRPAAYCGVVGFKPSFGCLSTSGVTPLSPSFDTVGVITRSVGLAERAFLVMAPQISAFEHDAADVTMASLLLPTEVRPSAEMHVGFLDASAALRAQDLPLVQREIVADIDLIVTHHRRIMNFEAARAHGHFLTQGAAGLLKPKFKAGVQAGMAVSQAHAEESAGLLAEAKVAFWQAQSDIDVILTLAVPEAAPLIGATTGYQDWLTPWTVFGGPLISLPWGLDSLGRPLSVMLAAAPGQDAKLLSLAHRLEALSPLTPYPKVPGGV